MIYPAKNLVCAAALVFCFSIAQFTQAEDVYYETLVKLETPKKSSNRSKEGGSDHALFRIWLPAETASIRGLVFNPFYSDAVKQQHWQAACRHWGFGILASNFFGVKKDEFPTVIDQALATFAAKSGRDELTDGKFCLVGMSAGAGMCVEIARLMPDRVIAVGPVCLEVGPQDKASMPIPMLTIFGERDGKQYEKLMAKLPEVRQAGGRFGIAVQWGRRHEFGQANNLLLPMFDAAIRTRLDEPGKPLRGLPESDGWLGDASSWKDEAATIAPFGEFKGDRAAACWLPDSKTAHAWQAFVFRQSQLRLKSPPGLGDKQPLLIHKPGKPILVELKSPAPKSITEQIEVFSGSRKRGELASGKLEVKFDLPGVYPLYLKATTQSGVVFSRPHTIIVAN